MAKDTICKFKRQNGQNLSLCQGTLKINKKKNGPNFKRDKNMAMGERKKH